MLPIETNAEKPRPRSEAFSSSASPSAPLWDEKPILPAGSARGAKVAFRPWPGTAMPRQFGPTSRAPCARTSASSCSCRSRALGAHLGEARRDDAQRRNAARERRRRGVEHLLAREADDGEVDRIGDLLDRAVRVHAGHRLAAQVHRVGRAGEVGGEDVAEQLAADRAAPTRGADHRDRLRLEERSQRRDHGSVVALLDARLELDGRDDREAHLDLLGVALPDDLEAGVGEDAEGSRVRRQDIGPESRDPALARPPCELLEQPHPDAAPLLRVRDRERHVGRIAAFDDDVVRHRDDPRVAGTVQPSEQSPAAGPVGIEQRLDEAAVDRAVAVEAQVQAALREPGEEVHEVVGVSSGRRLEPDRAAVAQDHIDCVECNTGHGCDHRSSQRGRCRWRPSRGGPRTEKRHFTRKLERKGDDGHDRGGG